MECFIPEFRAKILWYAYKDLIYFLNYHFKFQVTVTRFQPLSQGLRLTEHCKMTELKLSRKFLITLFPFSTRLL